MTYETASLRKFLTELFSAQELTGLLFDYFRDVYDDVTPTMPKKQQIQMLLEHASRQGKMEHLLSALAQEKPGNYRRDLFTQDCKSTTTLSTAIIQRNPNQIFISHAHQDAKFAHKLANDLEAHGYHIWIAPDSIQPGEKWAEAISRGLDESATFVLLLTPDAVNSRWVRDETFIAIEMEKAGEISFLPLQIKACRLPALWRAYQRIPFRSGYGAGFNQLRTSLDTENHLHPLAAEPQLTRIEVVERQPPRIETPPDRIIWPKDGKEMVLVPAGEFLYGENKEKVSLSAFYIDKTAVTNAEYKLFLDATPDQKVPFLDDDWAKSYNWNQRNRTFPKDKANHPVVLVSWYDAQAYANWAEKLLPNERQWEKAARGTDGREYPWGSWQDQHCNTRESRFGLTSPVGQFSPQGDSPYGCVDMSGNVWEWMINWSDDTEKRRALRGGSWSYDHRFARVSFRYHFGSPNSAYYNIGFRLVAPVGSGS